MRIQRIPCAAFLGGLFLTMTLTASFAIAQSEGKAQFVITANAKGSQTAPVLQPKDLTVTMKNRPAEITDLSALRGQNANLQLVFLFDESASSYLALQFSSLRKFIDGLPPSAEVGTAYMANGRAVFTQSLTSDHALAGKGLRLPNSIPGISGSPYFCLSDLAKRWPSTAKSRRVVFMVTNGVDPYYMQRDMQDPYVMAAIADAQRAGILVYAIYFHGVGFRGGGQAVFFGQNYLLKLSGDTGGESYATNLTSTPVSFDPYLKQFKTSLDSQYMVSIAAQGSGLQRIKVKSNVRDVKLSAPAAVNVGSGQ